MNFFLEWALAVHRAVWFPFNWAIGLERPALQAPIDLTPVIAGAEPVPMGRERKPRSTKKLAA